MIKDPSSGDEEDHDFIELQPSSRTELSVSTVTKQVKLKTKEAKFKVDRTKL